MSNTSTIVRFLCTVFILVVIICVKILPAQEAFPATHVAMLGPILGIPYEHRGEGAMLARVDPALQQIDLRITLATPGDTVTLVNVRRRVGQFPSSSDPLLLALNYPEAQSTVTTTLTVSQQSVYDALDSAGLYLDVRSTRYPEGFLTGMISQLPFATTLEFDGSDVVPEVDSTGSGKAQLVFDPATGAVRYQIEWSGLREPATGIAIHNGGYNENGPMLYSAPVTQGRTSAFGTWTNFSPTHAAALREGRLYVVVQTPTYPNGEIRGVLLPIAAFGIALDPANEVPPNSESFGGGTAVAAIISIPGSGSELFLNGVIADLTDSLTGVLVHSGPAGTNGPMVDSTRLLYGYRIQLDGPYAPQSYEDSILMADLLVGNGYLNVYTRQFPEGEIRGQFIPAEGNLPTANVPATLPSGTTVDFKAFVDTDGGRVQFLATVKDGLLDGHIVFSTIDGRCIATAEMEEGHAAITTASLPTGLYLAQLIRNGLPLASCRAVIVR